MVLGRDRLEAREVSARAHQIADLLPRDRARLGEEERRRGAIAPRSVDAAIGELEDVAPRSLRP